MTTDEIVALALTRRLAADGSARRLREENGLSLADVGNAIGTSPTTIWRWEHGERSPHGNLAIRYAAVLSGLIGISGPGQ
jgi:transcriptional regulator with XRE-family HTH domain